MEIFSSFSTLPTAAKVYFIIAIASSSILIIQLLLSMVGFEHDHSDIDHDFSGDTDHDLSGIEGITFFSMRSLVAFFVFFGWVGFICMKTGLWAPISLIPALCAGSVALVGVAYLMHFFYSMAESGTVKMEEAVGEIGTVYLKIPENKQTGAVNVPLAGAIREYKAVSEDGGEIQTGKKVHVVGTMDHRTLIVKEVRQPSAWLEEGIS